MSLPRKKVAPRRRGGPIPRVRVAVRVAPPVREVSRATEARVGGGKSTKGDTVEVAASDMARLIPDAEFYDTYKSRKIGGHSDLDIFRYARKAHLNVLVFGPTGPGKTSAVMAYAAKDKLPFYSVPCNVGIDPSELFGKYMKEGEKWVWQDGPVTTMVRHGGVLLINEINMMPAKIAAALFSLLDKRRQIQLVAHKGEVITAHPDFQVIADMNPGYEGTRDLNAALKNRFPIKLDWGYEPAIEKQLVGSNALLELAGKLRARQAAGDIETPVSTNMLQEFERIATDLGVEFAVSNFISAFDADERPAMKQVLDLYHDRIKDDFRYPGIDKAKVEEAKRALGRDPVVDENGIEGIDWRYEDEELTPEDLRKMPMSALRKIALENGIDPKRVRGLTQEQIIEMLTADEDEIEVEESGEDDWFSGDDE